MHVLHKLLDRQVDCNNEQRTRLNTVESHLASAQGDLANLESKCEEKEEWIRLQREKMESEDKTWQEQVKLSTDHLITVGLCFNTEINQLFSWPS